MFISLSLLVYPLLALAAVPRPLPDHHLPKRHPEPRENPKEVQGVLPPERCVVPCVSVYSYASNTPHFPLLLEPS